MFLSAILPDQTHELPADIRLQRLVGALHEHFACGAVGLLKLEGDRLHPMALHGLTRETLGRRFIIAEHPRLSALLNSRDAIRFAPGSPLPDPYDGLLEHRPGAALQVHDCMGTSLFINGQCWGILTLDSLLPGSFDADTVQELQRFRPLIETIVRIGILEQNIRLLRQNHPIQDFPLLEQGTRNHDIIGQSSALQTVLQELSVVADSDLPVLLLGETGVGKELFARQLHQLSPRRNKPLVYVNCAALPENLAESELFGHVKGAFSGAENERSGRFEAAEKGTIFLDEVGDLPPSIQVKLLRVLQSGEIQRLGSDRFHRVDVRIVAATNRDLKQQMKEGSLRADFYHRLSVYPLPIPPLRERTEDIPLLAGHFLELNRNRLGLRSLRLSTDAERALLAYPWPGNIREMEHAISRAAIKALSRGAERGGIVTLTAALLDLDTPSISSGQPPATVTEPAAGLSLKEAVQDFQRRLVLHYLEQTHHNWKQTAHLLDVDASNLHKLAQRLGIKIKKQRDRS